MVGWNKLEDVVVDPYSTGHLYIIEGRDRAKQLPRINDITIRTQHQKKVDRVYNLFKNHTNFKITDVFFPHGSTSDDWTEFWNHNNVEIIARPPLLQDPRGNIIPNKGDFNESVVRNLKEYAKNLKGNGKFAGHKALKSIPEIMARDTDMYSNPLRPVWFDRTRYEDEGIVCRGKISPELSRQAGKDQLVFVRERIQGPGKVKWPAPVMEQIAIAREQGRSGKIYNMENMPVARPEGEVASLEDGDGIDEDEGFCEPMTGNSLFFSGDDSDLD
ncbi:hypothetical protein B0A55_09370 [Friedmanniomyces simplex]|uniref:Uncharacterized protein n=1 Tax=Friedmanniomyces simplex TaxID=329884 RepID=A0A4U0WWT0_9PEZI|nr:hypothetical protein B0A55_09370 [Friedmanniomyces simplex]